MLSVLALAWAAGCSAKPAETAAKEHLTASWRAEIGDAAKVAAFKKIKTTEGDMFGLKFRDMEYSYDLLCSLPVPVKALRRFSRENVILLDEFIKNQTEPWEKIDFTPVLRVRLDGAARKAVADAYAGNKSLFLCKPGQKVAMTGTARLVLKADGWAAE